MGFKRPIEDEDLNNLPLKHSKQVNFGNDLTSFSQNLPDMEEHRKTNVTGKDDDLHLKIQYDDSSGSEDEDLNNLPLKHSKQVNFGNDITSFSKKLPDMETHRKTNVTGKDDELHFKIQYNDSSGNENDTGSGPVYFSPFSHEIVDFHFPVRLVPWCKDAYSRLLVGPPRKQVPIGADYQAAVSAWDPHDIVDSSNNILMGENIHQLPDQTDELVVHGRKGCTCPDVGSIRCVQQHVKEAREALRVTLGDEKFVKLGFCDMGEVVSDKWSDEEERDFHKLVYRKSIFRSKDHWENLSTVFPYRKKREIVCYYFNVFIFRKRSVQNRSTDLDIDSDDDNWDESYWCQLGFEQEDQYSGYDSSPLSIDREYRHPINDNEDHYSGYDSPLSIDGEDRPIKVDVDKIDGKKDSKVVLSKNGGESTNGWDPGIMPCKSKVWDDFFPMSPLKFVDHPPTRNMMEYIFGPCPNKNNRPFL